MTRARHTGLRVTDLLLLGIAASFGPLGLMASNVAEIVHPERIIGLILLVWLLGVGVAWGLIRLGVRRLTAVRSVFIAVVLLMSGGRVLREFGAAPGWAIILLVIGLGAVVFSRLGNNEFVKALMVGLAVALSSGVLISLYMSLSNYGESLVVDQGPLGLEMKETPDVFIVVVDGYPGLEAIAMDSGVGKDALISDLEARGFQVPSSAWSSYWSTVPSLASLLNMDYPIEKSSEGIASRQALYDVISGENALVSIMERSGYETYMVESGWSGGACGSAFDKCVPSPFLDEAVFFTLWETVAGPYVFSRWGYAYPVATKQSMGWLLENGPALSRDDRPSLVFAHLIAPHAPFFLDETCQRVVSVSRSGNGFNLKGTPVSEREGYFAGQMACVDRFMVEFADSVESDDVVVFVGDHGTDRRGQVQTPGTEWDQDDFVERMNVFVAVRVADGCAIGEEVINPNLLRRVLSCYSPSPVEDLPSRFFLPGMSEVDGFGP